jgi:hypothetical protein
MRERVATLPTGSGKTEIFREMTQIPSDISKENLRLRNPYFQDLSRQGYEAV